MKRLFLCLEFNVERTSVRYDTGMHYGGLIMPWMACSRVMQEQLPKSALQARPKRNTHLCLPSCMEVGWDKR